MRLATLSMIAVGLAAGAATAAPAPDFHATRGDAPAATDSTAASDGRAPILPVDIVPFAFDSAAIDPVAEVQLRAAARWLRAHPDYRLVLAGHTDATGGAIYNIGLADRRARAARAVLLRYGAPRDRVVTVVYGEAHRPSPIATAAANRVVELRATTADNAGVTRAALPAATAVIWDLPTRPLAASRTRTRGARAL